LPKKGLWQKKLNNRKCYRKNTKQPLEYATVTYKLKSAKTVAGGITNPKGEFIDVSPGIYTIKIEFISFKSILIKEHA
jgi:hypothetical protein